MPRCRELGQRAKAVSSFAVRNYGFTRLSELIKAVPNFEVKVGDGRPAAGQAPALSRCAAPLTVLRPTQWRH